MANELTYQSEFTGQQMDERFTAVAQLQAALADMATALAAKYVKPATGIPETDLDAAVQSALTKARSAVQDLSNYYTKTEIDALLSAVNSQEYVDVASLPTASASTLGKIYLVGPDANSQYTRYYTSYNGSTYSWVAAGSTEINLANYATKAEVSQLDQEVDEISDAVNGVVIKEIDITSSFVFEDNKYIGANSSKSTFGAYTSDSSNTFKANNAFVDISAYAGSTMKLAFAKRSNAQGEQTDLGCAFYSADNTPIAGVQFPAASQASGLEFYELEVVIDSSWKKLRTTYFKDEQTYGAFYCKLVVESSRGTLQEQIDVLDDVKLNPSQGVNLIDPSKLIAGYGIKTEGTYASQARSVSILSCTDYIPVTGDVICNGYFGGTGNWGGYVYNSAKEPLRAILTEQYTYQEGDAYIRLSFQTNNSQPCYANAGTYLWKVPYSKVDGYLEGVKEEIGKINTRAASVGLAAKWTRGVRYYRNTYLSDAGDNYATSDYLPCIPGGKFKTNINAARQASGFYAVFFDAAKVVIGNVQGTDIVECGVYKHTEFTALSDSHVAYMRVSSYVLVNADLVTPWVREKNGVDDIAHIAYDKGVFAADMMRDVLVQATEANPYSIVDAERPLIAFHFDDGDPVVSDMIEEFIDKQAPLCLAIPASRLGATCPNGKTLAENLHDMVDAGGEVMTHSIGYLAADATEADIKGFFVNNKAGLLAAGFDVLGVVNAGGRPEEGYINDPMRLAWLKRYLMSTHNYGIHFTEISDPRYNYIRTGLSRSLDLLKELVAERIAQGKSWIFNAHAPYDVDPEYAVFATMPSASVGAVYSIEGVGAFKVQERDTENNRIYFDSGINGVGTVPTGGGTMTKVSGTGDDTLTFTSFHNTEWAEKIGALIDWMRETYTEGTDFEIVDTRTWMARTRKSAAQLYMESLNEGN